MRQREMQTRQRELRGNGTAETSKGRSGGRAPGEGSGADVFLESSPGNVNSICPHPDLYIGAILWGGGIGVSVLQLSGL